jgi:hypothetical protein
VPGAPAAAAREPVRPAKPAGSHRDLGAVAAATAATARRPTTGEPHGRVTTAAGPPLWWLSGTGVNPGRRRSASVAGVPVAAAALAGAPVVARAAAPPVRAALAPAWRVPAALLDQHRERSLAPSCRAPRRRAPRAQGNDLRTPGDDSRLGPAPTARRQTCVDVMRACLRMPNGPDPGELSTSAERARWHPNGQVFIVSWTCGGLPGGVHAGGRERPRVGPAGDRVMDAVRSAPDAGRAHAGGPGHLVVYCQAQG